MAAERKGKKLRRCTAASKAYYKLQYGKTDDNAKRRLGRHIRHFPEDRSAQTAYDARYGKGASGHAANATARAKRRAGPIRNAAACE